MIYKAPTIKLGRIVGTRRRLDMTDEDLRTHLYIVGGSRRGKTKLLENILLQIIRGQRRNGPGLLLLDPHGTLYHDLARYLTDHRVGLKRPVLFVDPSRDDFVVPYNILRHRVDDLGRPAEPSVIARQVLKTLSYVWGEAGTQATPRFHRNALNLLLTLYTKGYTTNEAYHYLHAFDAELRRALTNDIDLPTVAAHWHLVNSMIKRDYLETIESTINRFEPMVSQPRLTRMFGHPDRSIDFRRAMDEGWIILCNLSSKGSQFEEDDGYLLGTLLLSDLWSTARDRGKASGKAIETTRPFVVAIDEVQNTITPTIAKNLDQASGFGLRLIMAHQYPGQLTDDPKHVDHGKMLLKSILTNCVNKIVFGGLGHDEDIGPLAEVLYRGVWDPYQVKHVLESTKVLDYKLEYEKAYTQGSSTMSGGASSQSSTSGSSSARSGTRSTGQSYDAEGIVAGTSYSTSQMDAFNSYMAESSGETSNWAEGSSESVSDIPVLKPILGKEASAVQFLRLEEQRYLAMAALFDQKQRQCVVRLASMDAPVNLFAPFLKDGFSSEKSVEGYIQDSYQNWPDLALPADEATRLVQERREAIEAEVQRYQGVSRQLPSPYDKIKDLSLMTETTAITYPIKVPGAELSKRDVELLQDIFQNRFITIEHAGRLYYESYNNAQRRLAKLVNADLLKKQPVHAPGLKTIYRLDKSAFELLRDHELIPVARDEPWEGKYRKRCTDKVRRLGHELRILDVKAALQPAIQAHPEQHLKILDFGTWPERYTFEKGPDKNQEPDGFLHVAEFRPNSEEADNHFFYIELDHNSNEDSARIMVKVDAYLYHWQKGGFLRFLGAGEGAKVKDHPFRVLFIIATPDATKRRNNIAQKMADGGIGTFIALATLDQLKQDPLGSIFITPKAYKEWQEAGKAGPIPTIPLFENLSTGLTHSEVAASVVD